MPAIWFIVSVQSCIIWAMFPIIGIMGIIMPGIPGAGVGCSGCFGWEGA
jgi:hypothetical protein